MTIIERFPSGGCGCDAPEKVSALVSLDQALRRIERHATPITATQVLPLAKATGRILAEPVAPTAPTPPFDAAAMDGFAVATHAFAGDGPWTFPVTGRIPAGQTGFPEIPLGAATRIFTGAPVPQGTNAVIPQEDACHGDGVVTFRHRPDIGLNIRCAGDDMRPGQIVAEAGTRLGQREIAACAAAGRGTVPVRRALRVCLLVTGDEIRKAGTDRRSADIWDVNTPMLVAALSAQGIDLIDTAHAPDTRDGLQQRLVDMAETADLIVTTGGISVGEEDHVKPALSALGATFHFSGVAIKPGKPVSFGRLGRAFWLGLPGNPLAAFIMWQVFGTALTRQLTGQSPARAARRHVVTGSAIRRKPGRCELRPATLAGFDDTGREVVTFETATQSARVGRLAQADGLMFLPADVDHLPAGALVDFAPFGDV